MEPAIRTTSRTTRGRTRSTSAGSSSSAGLSAWTTGTGNRRPSNVQGESYAGDVLALSVSLRPALAGFAGMDQGAPEPRFRVDEEAPVSTLSGVGPKVAERLAALGIESVRDLAEHVPRDFLDWSEATGFAALRLGQEATVECTVERARLRPTRRRNLKLVEAGVVDGEGGRATAVWFNQAWLAERLVPGTRVLVHGQLQVGGTFEVERHALEELIVLQLGLLQRRRELEEESVAPALGAPGELLAGYRKALPFAFTPEQEQAIVEIDSDLRGTRPMQRLLQGDVGSGKTVVALYALLRAVERGHQGALMAPTETLAEQHYLTVEPICAALGVRAALLTGSVRGEIEDADLVVGTHALIQEGVEFRSLAVAVVDEQHRFGVEQRRALGASTPHVLHMTATPIPRTLAQTVYGDLDVTEIARPPKGRRPVVTSWVSHDRAAEAYKRLRRHLQEGRQAYVVCPLVSESEAIEARAAEQEAERLRQAELRDFRVGCLHGRMRPADRRAVMEKVKRGELNVLVATTVIEVGVDIPNATIMIVQEADRFGLAQLHQLRGRVGRGAEQSYCLLVSRPKEELTEEAQRRLEALVETSDGFKLAEVDLELRGEGQLLGTRQSGLPDLKFASLTRDRKLVEKRSEEHTSEL